MGKKWSPFYWRTQKVSSKTHCYIVFVGRTQIFRIFQNTPGTYPAPPSNNLWRNSFHLGVDASRLCWGSLSIVFSWGTSYKNEVCKQGQLTYDHCNPLLRSVPFMDTLQSLQPIDKSKDLIVIYIWIMKTRMSQLNFSSLEIAISDIIFIIV